jgi:hypothetical protein
MCWMGVGGKLRCDEKVLFLFFFKARTRCEANFMEMYLFYFENACECNEINFTQFISTLHLERSLNFFFLYAHLWQCENLLHLLTYCAEYSHIRTS